MNNAPRALVVEDELLIAMAMEDVLQDLGYEVVGPFSTVGQARGAAEGEPLDLGVLDMNLRGELVFPIAEALRRRGVPVVFCTGYADMPLIPESFRNTPILSKPCTPDGIRAAIERSLSPLPAES